MTPADAYLLLHERAAAFDRSNRRRFMVAGDRAIEVLNGLVTSDVAALGVGEGQFAMALTAKGRVLADLRIFRLPDALLVDTGPRAGDGFGAMLRKYVNPRLARCTDVSTILADVSVFGPGAAGAVGTTIAALDPAVLGALEPFHSRTVVLDEGVAHVARIPDAGVPGYALFVPPSSKSRLIESLGQAGAPQGDDAALEVARIEAGRPEWGTDIDDTTLAPEAQLDGLGGVSYRKGCYTGQEVVARVHFRGHANRLLRGLRFDATDGLPPAAAELRDEAGMVVGTMGSSAGIGASGVGLGIVRREVVPGAPLVVERGGGHLRLVVHRLPYQDA